MSPAHPFDASIPVLTEVLEEVPEAADKVAVVPADVIPAAVIQAAVIPTDVVPAAPQQSAAAHTGDDLEMEAPLDLEQLQQQLSERILHQLQSRVDFVLEQRLKDSMEEVLSHALRGLTAEIRHGLHDTLSKIVTRAVAQELTHLQAQKK